MGAFRAWAAVLCLLLLLWPAGAQAQPVDVRQAVVDLRSAELTALSGTRAVELPHVLEAGDFSASGSRVAYRLELNLAEAPEAPLGIFIPKLSLSGQMALNGQWIGACAVGAPEMLRCKHRPWLVVPPGALWRAGPNELLIELNATGRQINGLSPVSVGPLQKVEQERYFPQYALRILLMQALTWTTAALGFLALMISHRLPGRSMYTWVGVACLVHALSHVNFLSSLAWVSVEFYSWFAYASRMAAVPFLFMAVVAFYGRDARWQHLLALAYVLVGVGVLPFVENQRQWALWYYVPLLVCAVPVWLAMLRWTWRSRRPAHLTMLLASLAMVAASGADWQLLRGEASFEGIYVLSYASAGFLAVMGGLVLAELAAGLLKSRQLTATLEQQVAEREQLLALAYEERLQLERRDATNHERERLLADMHDSLGAGLSSAHLLLRQGRISLQSAAYVVQQCMDDLRLVFDVSANLEHNLEAVVADVRHRIGGRLASVGLDTRWSVALDGMPVLDSTHCLQLMRVLQEALANAVRHAQARRLNVQLHWQEEARQLLMRVSDDGVGLQAALAPTPGASGATPARAGQGLANMARRAAMLGAQLDIRSAGPGTVVELRWAL